MPVSVEHAPPGSCSSDITETLMKPLLKTIGTLAAAMLFVGVLTGASAGWFTDETPPANAKPLSEVIKALEDQGYRTITEVEFEDGVWEIEVHETDGKEIKLKVNPVSGEVRR